MKLEVLSSCKLKTDLYCVEFNDGILLNIRYLQGRVSGSPEHMCSVGVDSYFYRKGYFPKGNNLRQRLMLGVDTIKQRIKRYRRGKDVEQTTEG